LSVRRLPVERKHLCILRDFVSGCVIVHIFQFPFTHFRGPIRSVSDISLAGDGTILKKQPAGLNPREGRMQAVFCFATRLSDAKIDIGH
jgi:hypothetical protein